MEPFKDLKNKMISGKDLSDKWEAAQVREKKFFFGDPKDGDTYLCQQGTFRFCGKKNEWVKTS